MSDLWLSVEEPGGVEVLEDWLAERGGVEAIAVRGLMVDELAYQDGHGHGYGDGGFSGDNNGDGWVYNCISGSGPGDGDLSGNKNGNGNGDGY